MAEAIARDDFRAAEVKKLGNLGHGKFYRARLDGANRLLFSLVRHGGETCALMLEVIANHDYGKSRFLRGAAIDETRIPDVDAAGAAEAQPVRYLHPERSAIHFLDKPISFDDAQETVYRLPPPLIVVGSAGSGKTALSLEKLKHAEGRCSTSRGRLSRAERTRPVLRQRLRTRGPGGEVPLVPRVRRVDPRAGRARSGWREFSGWFARHAPGAEFQDVDGHQAFEEIRGVIAARAGGVLSREEYQALVSASRSFPRRTATGSTSCSRSIALGSPKRALRPEPGGA